MKLYKTKTGIVIETNGQFFSHKENWSTFINDDDLFQKIATVISTSNPADRSLIKELLPPIGENQELWACGVTYLRSKVGRQEESKTSGGADFYAKVYEAERPEVFFKSNPHRIVGPNTSVRIRKDSILNRSSVDLSGLTKKQQKLGQPKKKLEITPEQFKVSQDRSISIPFHFKFINSLF